MSYKSFLSYSSDETKNFAKNIANDILERKIENLPKSEAITLSLEGDLGAGKTIFAQGFAEGLRIKEKIQSPTFVILKIYNIPKSKKNFIHVDAYRLQSKDFKILEWKGFIKNPTNIILVEWGNKIKNILPKNSIRIVFKHGKKNSERYVNVNL